MQPFSENMTQEQALKALYATRYQLATCKNNANRGRLLAYERRCRAIAYPELAPNKTMVQK